MQNENNNKTNETQKIEAYTYIYGEDNLEDFIDTCESSIESLQEAIAEDYDANCDLQTICDNIEKYAQYNGISYGFISAFISYRGDNVENIFNAIPFQKAYLDDIKSIILEEYPETEEEYELVDSLKTMKDIRAFLKTNPMGSDWELFRFEKKTYFVSCLTA